MKRNERGCNRSTTLTTLALLLLLLGLPLAMPWAPAEDLTITTFSGDGPVIDVTFREEAGNASTAIELPKGCTVLSAEMDIEGVRMRGDDVRTLNLSDFDPPTTPHRAWRGWVQGNYPPSYPFWDPSSPQGTAFNSSNYGDVGASDDVRLRTATGQQTTNRYPFHLFRFMVPEGTLTGLEVGWEGFGYCLADTALPRGAEMFVWRNASSAWDRVDWYGKNEAANDRNLTKTWTVNPGRYVDGDDQVFILVLGKKSQNVAGPNPWTANGEIQTDYVQLNVTLAGDWEYVANPSLSIQPAGVVWSRTGTFTSKVRIGAIEGLHTALQQAVDAVALEPGNVTIPLTVNVSQATASVIRLSNLSVTVRQLENQAPSWTATPTLSMNEDQDALKLQDLSLVAYDDYSHDRLVYDIVSASTDAVEARIDDGHFLSVLTKEANWWGTATFLINATDAWGISTTSPSIEVQVREINDPPMVSTPGRLHATQDVPFQYMVVASDPELDPVTFAIDTQAFDIDAVTGEINFTPTNDEVGLHVFNISVSDGRGGESMTWMELDVANVNDPPVIRDPGPLSGVQGVAFEQTFIADDLDMDHGEQLAWSILGDDFYKNNLQLNPLSGVLTWLNVGNSDVGIHTFIVQVMDSQGTKDRVNVTLTVTNVNDPPTFPTIPDLTVFEDGRLSYSIKISDPDVGVDPGERLTWVVEPALFSISEAGILNFVPNREHVGNHTILVTVTDTSGESFSQSFKVIVKAINHPPTIVPIADQTVTEDIEWTVEIIVDDIDPDDEVQVSARGAPFAVPASGGLIVWTPEQRHVGEHLVTIEALDSAGSRSVMAFNLKVIGVNDPPSLEILVPYTGQEFLNGEAIRLTALSEDEEGEHLSIVWRWRHADSPNEQWTSIDTGTEVFWTEPPHGKILVRVEASDSASTVSDEVVLDVEAPPPDDEGGMGSVAIALVVIIALVVLLLLTRGRLWNVTKKPALPPETAGEDHEDEWEDLPDEEDSYTPWLR